MIKFDINKVRVETYYVKSLTTALGGAIRIVDEEVSTDEREVYHRLPVPMAVVRAFKKRYDTVKYLRPCLIAVTYYEDRVIALERHPAGCMGEREYIHTRRAAKNGVDAITEKRIWTSVSERNIEKVLRPFIEKHGDWYFDGRYMFSFGKTVHGKYFTAEEAVHIGDFLTQDGRFRCVDVNAIGLHEISNSEKFRNLTHDRTCLAYVAKNGVFSISPPIWKNARQVGEAKIKGTHKEATNREMNFDRVDQFCAVNLSFALKAAKDLSKEFGFEAIEPLNLPHLMVQLNTVNLPRVASEVKDTFDSGLKFTHALAWMLGFARRCEDLDTYARIRGLIKHLTSNGLYFRQIFDPKNIFKEGHDLDSIPLKTKEEALQGFETMSIEDRLEIIRNHRTHNDRGGNVVAGTGLFVDDDE